MVKTPAAKSPQPKEKKKMPNLLKNIADFNEDKTEKIVETNRRSLLNPKYMGYVNSNKKKLINQLQLQAVIKLSVVIW